MGEKRMGNRLFVGNLPYRMQQEELVEVFAQHGAVTSAIIVKDRFSGRSRGFGFVEMETDEVAAVAMQALDGVEVAGRRLRVNVALPKAEHQHDDRGQEEQEHE